MLESQRPPKLRSPPCFRQELATYLTALRPLAMLFTSRAVEMDSLEGHALKYWIGFNRAKGIGPIRLRALIQYFGSIEAAWTASSDALQAAGIDQRALASLLSTRATCDLGAELRA